MPDAGDAGEGLKMDPDLQKLEKNTIFALRAKIVFFNVFDGPGPFRDLAQSRGQAKLPKALPGPENLTKTPKTPKPEKPSEGDLRREGRGSS